MRFLHTADWHVGKGLQGRSRISEHAGILEEIVGLAREREVDATLIAGDLFDSASPPAEAEKVVYSTLLDLAAVAPVVLLPGNHDNDKRLSAVQEVFERAGVHVVPFVNPEPVEIASAGGERALVATIPWISQRYIVRAEELMKMEAYELGAEYSTRLARIVEKVCAPFGPETVNILMAHVAITGGELGGGERSAQTIMEYRIDASAFPSSAHYVALGHLHKAQSFPARCPVHYSGAPLHLDFSDDPGAKSVNIIDAAPGKPAKVESVSLTSGRALKTIEGTLAQLEKIAESVADEWLRVIVKEKARTDLGKEVRDLFPNAVRVVIDAGEREPLAARESIEGKPPHELFEAYLTEAEIDDPALVALFKEIHDEVSA